MKVKLLLIILSFSMSNILYSCSDDEGDKSDQENEVTFKVWSNTPNVPITLSEFYKKHLIIKNYWEGTYTTKQYGAQFSASCEDPEVLITGEIYVNGKFRLREDGNRKITLRVRDIKR